MRIRKKVLSVLLAASMIVPTLVPSAAATAAETEVPENLALGKTVTANPAMGEQSEASLQLVTDGKVENGWDKSFCYHTANEAENTEIKPYIQIDLEESYDVDSVKFIGLIPPDYPGYKNEPRNVIIQLSNDENFADDSTAIVFNSDKNNFFGLGAGSDTTEQAVKEGKMISFEPVNARYVRYYQHGAKQSDHSEPGWVNAMGICELEVYSSSKTTEPPEIQRIPDGNMAYQATVTGATFNSTGASISDWWGGWSNNDLQQITDGTVDDYWKAPRSNASGDTGHSTYLLIDMKKATDINTIKIWSKVGFSYLSQIVQVSEDGTNWKNVYNSDKNNFAGQDPSDSGKTVCGGKLTNGTISGVKAGNDTSYTESGNGNTISFDTTKARYIRWWCSGHTSNELPQMIQLQAYQNMLVTFDYNDGSEEQLVTITKGSTVSRPSTPISATPGILFDKWTVDKEGGEEWNFATPVTEDLKLVANWKKVAVHTVTFDTDGGTEIEPIKVTDTLAVARPENPEKEGKVFAGWKLNGTRYDFGSPVVADITLKATWVDPATPDAFTIHAGLLDIVLDSHGQVTNLKSTLDEKDYATLGPDNKLRSLVSLVADYQIETPTSLAWNEEAGELVLGFASIDTEATIALKDHGNYVSLTLAGINKPESVSLQAILWGPVKTSITTGGQTVGTAYDEEYAIGMHMLNTKTVGGWPIEFKDAFYAPDLSPVNGYPDPRVTRNIYSNTAAFSTWGSALNAYTWDYTEETMRTIAYFSEVPMRTPALTGYHADENASIIGSSIALYGTRRDNILNVISNIQLTEGLPHPTIDGEWQKTSLKTGQDFLVFNDAIWGLDVVENDAKMANAAGINYIYGQYGASGPWHGEGGYQFNGYFGGSDDSVKQMVEKAGEYNVYIGTHTLSNLISSGNHLNYMGEDMTSGLSYSGFAELTRDVSATDSAIYIADGYPFSAAVVNSDGGTRWLRIDGEIMGFSECTQIGDNEWKLIITQRGAHSTQAQKHEAGKNAYNLWSYYTTDFLGGWDAIEPMTDRMGYIYSDLGVHCMSYDSFESTKFGAYSSMMPAEYMKAVYNNVKDAGKADGFITEASDMDTNVWDVHSRISWGESNTPINAMMNYMSYYRQNFFPAMLGWMYDHGNHGGYGQSQLLMNLSMKGGWNAGAGWYVNRNTFKSYPYMADMLKTWNNAIQRGAFTVGEAYTEEIQTAMRNAWTNGRVWTLTETVADQEWVLQEVQKSNVNVTIGEPVTLTATCDIDITQPANGDIATNTSLEYSRAHAGDVVTVYVQPHMGYKMKADSLKAVGAQDGAEIALTPVEGETGAYTFVMPEQGVELAAAFEENAMEPSDPKVEKYKELLKKTYDYALTQSTEGVADSAAEFFETVKANAKAVLDDDNATWEEVEKAWTDLLNGIWGLGIVKGEKAELKALIDQANMMNEEDYVADNWPLLEDALAEAEKVYADEDATQDVIDAAKDALQAAIDAQELKPVIVVNKDILKMLIDKADSMTPNADKYVAANWPQLVDALEDANVVYGNADATQEEVDQAANALNVAILAQRFKADKSNLEELLKKVEGLNLEGYTAESVQAFKAALAKAMEVMADDTLSESDQQIVDNAVKALADATDALEKEDGSKTSNDNKTSDNEALNNGSKAPTTGDSASMLWIFMFAIVSAGTVLTMKRRKVNK